MKYCVHCGAEIHDEAVVCVKCGCSVEQPVPTPAKQDGNQGLSDHRLYHAGLDAPSFGLVSAHHHFNFQSYAGQKADWHRAEGV